MGLTGTNILKSEEKILAHMKPYNHMDTVTDCYFINTYFKGYDRNMYSAKEKVKQWVNQNGGTFKLLSDKFILGEKKGFLVQIRFPTYGYNGRDMKNIMSNLIYANNVI